MPVKILKEYEVEIQSNPAKQKAINEYLAFVKSPKSAILTDDDYMHRYMTYLNNI